MRRERLAKREMPAEFCRPAETFSGCRSPASGDPLAGWSETAAAHHARARRLGSRTVAWTVPVAVRIARLARLPRPELHRGVRRDRTDAMLVNHLDHAVALEQQGVLVERDDPSLQ